eukprot:TRINITY_DN14310_c0_g1_i1.p1 TRINITY_DN14310_c0_g1~~TRINITY_DN14310_c0_g1_i1.p1  ORF type:complete len:634 (+),score=161.59 TRINITY_DN14310_c0_g1_i1:126-2027(+)
MALTFVTPTAAPGAAHADHFLAPRTLAAPPQVVAEQPAATAARPVASVALGASIGLCLAAGIRAWQATKACNKAGRGGVRCIRMATRRDEDEITTDATTSGQQKETVEEAMHRLTEEISKARENQDRVAEASLERELLEVQMATPSMACRVLVIKECREAVALLKAADASKVHERVKAVRQLGRWLRWAGQGTTSDVVVPVAEILGGLLCALRSEPEVAWQAQCALFHAARGHHSQENVRTSVHGSISRLLLHEPSAFPLTLPRLSDDETTATLYSKALQTSAVSDFFSELRSLSLRDPGYEGFMNGETYEDFDSLAPHAPTLASVPRLAAFAKALGKRASNLHELECLNFEDTAMELVLPHISAPRLRSLRIKGAAVQTKKASEALLSLLQKHSGLLTELELDVNTESLFEAEDILVDMPIMPMVKKLTVRGPPCVPWVHFARLFPSLEELSFVYHQDFAMNSMEVLEEPMSAGVSDQLTELEEHTSWVYRDVVRFARDLQTRGFRRLGKRCPHLREINIDIADTSFCVHGPPVEEDHAHLSWRRPEGDHLFQRDHLVNSSTREALEEKSSNFSFSALRASLRNLATMEAGEEAARELADGRQVARSAGAAIMMRLVRHFDDASLEAMFGLL